MPSSDNILSQRNKRYAAIALFCLLAWLSIFLNLGSLSIRMWDESRNAVSAMEMLDNGEVLQRYFEGKPDTWETKPPLLTWLQAGSMKLFGYNELAARLPSAIAAFLTAVLLWWFCAKRNMFWPGFFAAMALMSSRGFNDLHIARTGDHDSILTLLIMAYSLLVFELVENEQGSQKKMLWLGLLISLAVLTKSIAGFFAVPGLLLYVIFSKKLGYFLRSKWLYAAIGILLTIVGGYYALREYYYPGQLELVWQNELLPRYTHSSTTVDINPEPWYFFLRNFFIRRLIPWVYFLPVFVFFGIRYDKTRALVLFSLLQGFCILLIISGGAKYEWYDAPIYPFLALMIGAGTVGMMAFFENIRSDSTPYPPASGGKTSTTFGHFPRWRGWISRNLGGHLIILKQRIPKASLFVLAIFTVLTIIGERRTLHLNRKLHTGILNDYEQTGYLIKEARDLEQIPFEYYVVTEGYYANTLFYKMAGDRNKTEKIHITSPVHEFKEGEIALTCQTSIFDKIRAKNPDFSILHESKGCVFMRFEKKSE